MLTPKNDLLSALPAPALDAIKSDLRLLHLQKGEILTAAPHHRHIFFPIDTIVAIFAKSTMTPETYLCLVGTLGCVGLNADLSAPGLAYTVKVSRTGHALAMPRRTFVNVLLRDNVDNVRFAATGMVAQLAVANSSCASMHSAQQRMVRILLEAAAEWPHADISLEHHEIAEFISVRRETVTHGLKQLVHLGLIECGRGHLRILDRARLADVACECYGTMNTLKAQWNTLWGQLN